MHERLSFYLPGDSLLHRLNPLTKLTLVFCVIAITFGTPFIWLPTILTLVVIIPLAFIARFQMVFFRSVLTLLLPIVVFLFVMQTLFLPGGQTVLFKVWVLDATLEGMQRAYYYATRFFVMVASFILLLLSTHPSELMSDLTRRGLPSQFAYVVVSTLQIIPQMQAKANTIIAAQRSRGLETEGSFMKRIRSLLPLVGPLVMGSLVEVEERAIAIEARAFTSKIKKTALHSLPDTTLDRVLRWLLVLAAILVLVSRLWLSSS